MTDSDSDSDTDPSSICVICGSLSGFCVPALSPAESSSPFGHGHGNGNGYGYGYGYGTGPGTSPSPPICVICGPSPRSQRGLSTVDKALIFRTLHPETSMRDIEGYRIIEPADDREALVVAAIERADDVLAAGLADPDAVLRRGVVERWISGGRAPHPVVRVDGEQWVVKSYRRGGLVARWNDDLYFGQARFFRELEVCERAVRLGVPTVRPIALVVRRTGLGRVRAWLVTPFVPGASTLGELLASPSTPGPVLFRAAGEVVRRMHEAGIDHPDLNLGNLLVRGAAPGAPAEVLILDWDRARVHGRAGSFAFRNLLRLFRSGRKLQPDPARLASCLRSFLRGYFSTRGPGALNGRGGLRMLKRYYRRRRLVEFLCHPAHWRRARQAPPAPVGDERVGEGE